jgi:hypothetical protein
MVRMRGGRFARADGRPWAISEHPYGCVGDDARRSPPNLFRNGIPIYPCSCVRTQSVALPLTL